VDGYGSGWRIMIFVPIAATWRGIPTDFWALGLVSVFIGVSPGVIHAFPSKSDTGHRSNTVRTAGMMAEFGVADV